MIGTFVTFEGVDFSGKTTQRKLLAEKLRAAGYDVVETREPGGTPYAEQIRELILRNKKTGDDEVIHPITELLLFQAARAQHVRNVIKPALEAGKIVLCDRFVMSTFAYQVWPHTSEADGTLMDLFYGSTPFVTGVLQREPVTFFFDLPKEERLKRKLARGDEINHFDEREDEFFAKVDEAFDQLKHSNMVMTIDANRSREVITDELFNVLVNYMKQVEEVVKKAEAKTNEQQ